jgi:hypothetical protein
MLPIPGKFQVSRKSAMNLIISAMNNEQKQFRRRLALLGALSLLGFAALAGRVIWLQAIQ